MKKKMERIRITLNTGVSHLFAAAFLSSRSHSKQKQKLNLNLMLHDKPQKYNPINLSCLHSF